MTLAAADQQYLLESMRIQKKLLRQKMDEMQAMDEAIDRTIEAIQTEQAIDWNSMLDLIHLTAVERSLKNQYQNAANISARIRLHREYSVNPQGWFPWIMQQCNLQPGDADSGARLWKWSTLDRKQGTAACGSLGRSLGQIGRNAKGCTACTGRGQPLFL